MLQAEIIENRLPHPRPDWREAESLQGKAKAAADLGEIEAAEAMLAKALRAHPALTETYNQLGRLYTAKGESTTAKRCFQGFLPEEFIKKHFSHSYSPAENAQATSNLRASIRLEKVSSPEKTAVSETHESFTRHHCAVETKRPITKPICLVPTTDELFKPTELKSTVAIVDQIHEGKLWFDGFNRMVLDGSKQIIDLHTRGSDELLHSICSEHEPYKIPGRCFFIGNRGFSNFCHWMVDILPAIGLFQQSGISFKSTDRFLVQDASSKFQRATLHHFGIHDEQIIELSKHTPYIEADELIMPYFQNAMAMTMGAWVPRFLKSAFLSYSSRSPINAKKLYLARPENARNGRGMPNEPELIEHLTARGFTAIHPEQYSVSQQAEIFAQADVILGAHGAAFTSIVFCRPGTSIIELYGDFMASSFWATSSICGLHYLNHYCGSGTEYKNSETDEFIHDLRQKGFSANLEDIDLLLDLEEDTHARPY